jgi:hypothetical protein
MSTSIFIATQEEVIQRNLLAQVGMDEYLKPGLLMLTMWYQRKFLVSSSLEGAFEESQDHPSLLRSAMAGDIIHLGKFFLITPTGFEEFTPNP